MSLKSSFIIIPSPSPALLPLYPSLNPSPFSPSPALLPLYPSLNPSPFSPFPALLPPYPSLNPSPFSSSSALLPLYPSLNPSPFSPSSALLHPSTPPPFLHLLPSSLFIHPSTPPPFLLPGLHLSGHFVSQMVDADQVTTRSDTISNVVLAEIYHFQHERVVDFRDMMKTMLGAKIQFYKEVCTSLHPTLIHRDL